MGKLTKQEIAAAKRAKCFDGNWIGASLKEMCPAMMVANLRGCRVVENKKGFRWKSIYKDLDIAMESLWDVMDWLGFKNPIQQPRPYKLYFATLKKERSRIFRRAKY